MDFFQISTKEVKGGITEIFPDFTVGRSKDLMVRGRAFYAIWDEERNLWSTDEYDVQRLVDQALAKEQARLEAEGIQCRTKFLHSFGSNGWNQFRKFVSNVSDNAHQLDEKLTFSDTVVKKSDYVSRRLPYPLQAGDYSAWDELVGTLYSPEERAKIEWTIGAIVSGDSKKIQKFLVLYGPAGTGKSTILNIVQSLFAGYVTTFEAKALTGNNNQFAAEVFRDNPLVAIQHDGDLSRIEDNTKLNSIISHEVMTINTKYKASYSARIDAFLYMGTNKPVKISDAKSGIIRRLIDVQPTGKKFRPNHYNTLMSRIEFELGAIAHHCLEVYRSMGKNYYNTYRPTQMMFQTDVFFNFIEAHYDIFRSQDGTSLKQAYSLYKEYAKDTGLEFVLPQYKFREELKNYFSEFLDRYVLEDAPVRSFYCGFTAELFKAPVKEDNSVFSLVLDETTSLFDVLFAGSYAQLANDAGNPTHRWANVKTTLSQIDTTKTHFVKVPENHIVIDFDLKDEDGNKSLERNLAAASEWPPTYAELSQSGAGVHLHYVYDGDVSSLLRSYADGVEIKVFSGDASLRRRLLRCNNVSVAAINSGLPLKEKRVLQVDTIQSERGLRELIARNLRKEIHPGTKPSIDFIKKILDDAYSSGMAYDLTDLKSKVIAFANNSSNQALLCLKTVQQMKFKSADICLGDGKEKFDGKDNYNGEPTVEESRLVFFDVEVFPNLLVICWKFEDSDTVIKMINPSSTEVEALFKFKLVGFNNRRYDNHILWARFMGYNNEQIYKLSKQMVVDGNPRVMFGEAYNLSYTDIYDFSSEKMSLKKFQIKLGILHKELDLPWDKPVEEKDIPRVVEYCSNDVISTEAVFKSRKQDFVARQILADLAGMSVNTTTNNLTARIIFGTDRNPQREFVYTNLSKEFPGYVYDHGQSTYRGEVTGEGGYVYAEPGMYQNVALLDVASMHPASIEQLNLFGGYTSRFSDLKSARMAIKNGDFAAARAMLGGVLVPYLEGEDNADELSYALKIALNSVYGLTSAKFDNPFRDVRNVDNIVAKRGALFMIDLKYFIQEQGFKVVHIKTDSVKIPDATPEIIEAVKLFGEKYGYVFEHKPEKDLYDKFCLVNDAVYIARVGVCNAPYWVAVGAQFQHPYVFKTLFSKEDINFGDLCEARSVSKGAMWLDFDAVNRPMFSYEGMQYVGRTGLFVPVHEGFGGGVLLRVQDDKPYAVAGTKGYLWVEADQAKNLPAEAINMDYFGELAFQAVRDIGQFGSFEEFVS